MATLLTADPQTMAALLRGQQPRQQPSPFVALQRGAVLSQAVPLWVAQQERQRVADEAEAARRTATPRAWVEGEQHEQQMPPVVTVAEATAEPPEMPISAEREVSKAHVSPGVLEAPKPAISIECGDTQGENVDERTSNAA